MESRPSHSSGLVEIASPTKHDTWNETTHPAQVIHTKYYKFEQQMDCQNRLSIIPMNIIETCGPTEHEQKCPSSEMQELGT